MFDFEKLDVYQKIRKLNQRLLPLVFSFQSSEPYLADQLKRAGLSVLLNLSEGTGRMSNPDKKQFYIRARSSVFECVAILQTLFDLDIIKSSDYEVVYSDYESISKMLLGMIRNTNA